MGFFKDLAGKVVTGFIEHQPVIATGVLVVTIAATCVVIYKESPKIHKAKEERDSDLKDIKENEEMTEEEKEAEEEKIEKEFKEKITPSAIKIGVAVLGTAGAVAFFSVTGFALTASTMSALKAENARTQAYNEIVKEQVPEKADDIEERVDKRVRELLSKGRYQEIDGIDSMEPAGDKDKYNFVDEVGNSWRGYYTDVLAAKNSVNEFLNDGDDVYLNQFYSYIPGCQDTIWGRRFYFPGYKGQINLKITAETSPKTGRIIRYIVQYAVHPVLDTRKLQKDGYAYDPEQETNFRARSNAGTAW